MTLKRKKRNASFILSVCLMAAIIVALMIPVTIAWFTDNEVVKKKTPINFGNVNVGINAPTEEGEGALTNKNSPTQRALKNLLPGDELVAQVELYNAGTVDIYTKANVSVDVLYNGASITSLLKPYLEISIVAPEEYYLEGTNVFHLTTENVLGNGYNIDINVKILETLPNSVGQYIFNGSTAQIKFKVLTKAAAIQKANYNNLETLDSDLTSLLGVVVNNYEIQLDPETSQPVLYKEGSKIETISATNVSPDANNSVMAFVPEQEPNTVVITGSGTIKNNTTTSTILPTQKSTIEKVVIAGDIAEVGDYSFYNYPKVEEVDLSGCTSLENIGSYAFTNCTNLTSVTLPTSIKTIEPYAFYNCTNLTEIVIPNGVEVIKTNAFKNCAFETIVLPSSVKSIQSYAFNGCAKLVNLSLNEGLETIEDYAFFNCDVITSFNIPSTVRYIGNAAFSNKRTTSLTVNNNNQHYYSENNCIITKGTKYLVAGCNTSVIPEGVYSIEWGAFQNCENLTSITLPTSLDRIGDFAFAMCTGLSSISIPKNVSNIGRGAFANMNLASITVDSNNSQFSSPAGSNCIIEYDTVVVGCKNTVLPTDGSIRVIGAGAFQNCKGLPTTFTIPKSVEYIADYAFHNANPEYYILPDNIVSIGSSVFGTPILSGFKFHNGESTNGSSSIKLIGDAGNGWYSGIKADDYFIAGTVNTDNLYTVLEIGTGAFNGIGMLIKLPTFDPNLKKIHAYAFSGCWNLYNIIIPESVEFIGTNAFVGTGTSWSNSPPIYMKRTSDEGLTLEANWHGGRPVYYYSETNKPGCWHFASDNSTPVLW